MKLRKVFIGLGVLACASTIPLGLLTSCSANTWGVKTPISIGDISLDSKNNPYYQFITPKYDADGLNMLTYLQSNYTLDVAKNSNYGYSTPVKKWFNDNPAQKITDIGQWQMGSPKWTTSADEKFVKTMTDKDKRQQICNANIVLPSNIDLVVSLANMMNQYITGALSYQASQISNNNDMAYAWGKTDESNKFSLNHGQLGQVQNNQFYEYAFAQANIHAETSTKALFKQTQLNFNFDPTTFPIPAYAFNAQHKKTGISPETYKMITGAETFSSPKKYYSASKKDKEKIWDGQAEKEVEVVTYTFNSVPVLLKPTNIVQTYLNPKPNDKDAPEKTDSFIINDYLNNSKDVVVDAIGKAWQNKEAMPRYTGLQPEQCVPTIKNVTVKFPQKEQAVPFEGGKVCKDERIASNVTSNEFIALMSYTVKEYQSGYSDHNTVTLGGTKDGKAVMIETIFPAYFISLFDDIYKKVDDSADAGMIFDSKKIDEDYNKELLNLIKRIPGTMGSQSPGEIPHAKDLPLKDKKLLQILPYLLANNSNVIDSKDWLKCELF